MATQTLTPPPSQTEPVVDATGKATRSWYWWFTQTLREALAGVVTDVTVAPPLTSSGTGTSVPGSSSGVVTISLGASGVTAGTYGDATHVGQFTVTTSGVITAAANIPISGGGSTGQYMPTVVGGLCVTLGDDLIAMAWTPA